MDTLASLALATEEPNEKLLERPPHSRHDYIISKTMLKHIVVQAIFQLTVIMVIVFSGEKWIPEARDEYDDKEFLGKPELKWHNGEIGGTVRSGRFYQLNGDEDFYPIHKEYNMYSRHFTFVFNTFVMMTVFNFINARKIHD